MPTLGGGENDQETLWRYFLPLAMRFDLRRHNCTATWKITRTSIELESADCDRDPLDADYQYYDNCQLNLKETFGQSIGDYIGDFARFRNLSHWKIPTNAAVFAAVFQATIAALEGFVTVQISGPRWNTKNNTTLGLDKDHYNETYMQMQTITRDVPTLRADWGLYFILALQPIVSVGSF